MLLLLLSSLLLPIYAYYDNTLHGGRELSSVVYADK